MAMPAYYHGNVAVATAPVEVPAQALRPTPTSLVAKGLPGKPPYPTRSSAASPSACGARTRPRSVMMAVTSSAGVTSKAG